MTCREFKHIAASFNLRELAQQQDAPMSNHIQSCSACEAWMEKQRSLNASLHTLRMRTAGLEAGPDVEGALLRVFRQGTPVANVSTATAQLAVVAGTRVAAGVKEPKTQAASRSTPFALRLSRFFEVGAYAAVAAAIVIAIFLGLHLLRQTHSPAPMQSQTIPASTAPEVMQSGLSSQTASVSTAKVSPKRHELTGRRLVAESKAVQQQAPAVASSNAVSADASQTDAEAGYVALMFCDPLSCASETQVVRMELPASAAGQPEVADVVVGYDGLVRAVRFVN